MKRIIQTFIFVLIEIAMAFGFTGCSVNTQDQKHYPVKELCGDSVGAYFITDKSYKLYMQNRGEESRPQSWYRCTIADNQLTVSDIYDTVYDISVGENEYIGKSIANTVSFWFNGDILCLNDNGKTMEYKKDNSYQRTETGTTLSAPEEVEVFSGGKGLGYVMFQWNYQYSYGYVGAAAEIKKAGSTEYKTVEKIERVYMNTIVVQLDESQFEVGENYVRLYHIGGPSITNDKSIIINKNSDYLTYRVIVDNDGNVVVKK